jgi:lipid A 3-O-deacylase
VRILILAAALTAATPAHADEIFGGVFVHAAETPLSLQGDRESGADLQLGYRGGRIGRTPLQPYVFGSLHTKGDTSFVAAGLSARFGRRLYVRPGIGLAIHNGSDDEFSRPDRLAFGSRILFEPELGVGYQLSDRASVEASWVHLSHGQLFSGQNPGMDSIGARLHWKL